MRSATDQATRVRSSVRGAQTGRAAPRPPALVQPGLVRPQLDRPKPFPEHGHYHPLRETLAVGHTRAVHRTGQVFPSQIDQLIDQEFFNVRVLRDPAIPHSGVPWGQLSNSASRFLRGAGILQALRV